MLPCGIGSIRKIADPLWAAGDATRRPPLPPDPGLATGAVSGQPRLVRTGVRITLIAAAIAALPACGPSFESLHESNVRFEHCHRLDFDPRVTNSHRSRCWNTWVGTYIYGQTSDRVQYAKRRLGELGRTDGTDSLLARVQHPLGSAGRKLLSPIDSHAPPPSVEPNAAAEVPSEEAQIDTGQSDTGDTEPNVPPGDASRAAEDLCSDRCQKQRTSCRTSCASADGACRACGKDYRGCMRRCFP